MIKTIVAIFESIARLFPDTGWVVDITPGYAGKSMRRRINGKWQYRPITDEEFEEWQSCDAW